MAAADEFEAGAEALKEFADELEAVVDGRGAKTALTTDTRRGFGRRRLDALVCDARGAAARVGEISRTGQ